MRWRGLALAAIASVGCVHAPFEPAELDQRALHDSVTTPEGEARFHAIPFPPRARTHPSREPLVVVEPVLFRRELLLVDGGLVATLEDAGYPVWLVGADADVPPREGACAEGIARAIGSAARATGDDGHVDVLALGFSGPAALGALDLLGAPGSPVQVDELVLLGTPLDVAYPGAVRGADLSVYEKASSDPRAHRWLGSAPPATGSDTLRARDRYPHLAAFERTSVLFIAGKIDGIAPTESSYPVYEAWGERARDPAAVHKRFFIAGLENGFARDYDAYGLLAPEAGARAVWDQVLAFFDTAP